MKNLKIIIVSVMMLLLSQVVLSQVEHLYAFDKQGNPIAEIIGMDTIVALCFEENVPELTDQQVSEFIKNGTTEVSREQVKGHYEQGILWYVPCFEITYVCYDGNTVSLLVVHKNGDPIFAFWFAFALLSIINMVITQIAINKDRNSFALVAFILAAAFTVVAFVACMFTVVAFAVAFAVFASGNNKKLMNICISFYYVCILAEFVFAYLQI